MGLLRVSAPAPRQLGSEINSILGISPAVSSSAYTNTAAFSPLYTALNAGNTASATNSLTGAYGSARGQLSQQDYELLAKFGPQYLQQLRAINPGQASIYDTLTQQAQQGLAAGSRLTPDQTYSTTNPARADWAARGFSADAMPGQLDQAVNLARAGDNVRGQRQQFAQSVLDQGNQIYTQPAAGMALSGGQQAGNILGLGSQVAGASGAQSDSTNSLLGYGNDLFNTNYNADAAAKIATANNRMGVLQAGLGAVQSANQSAMSY